MCHFFQALKRKILLKGKKIEIESVNPTGEVSDEDEAAEMNKHSPVTESPPTNDKVPVEILWNWGKGLSVLSTPLFNIVFDCLLLPHVEIKAKSMQGALRPNVLSECTVPQLWAFPLLY